jgi:hypothetical protein
MDKLGVLESTYPGWDLAAAETDWPCTAVSAPGAPGATIANAEAQHIVTTYMVAFLETYLRDGDGFSRIPDGRRFLTPGYAKQHQPEVYFFDSEECSARLRGHSDYTYRPVPGQCLVAPKDPPDYF